MKLTFPTDHMEFIHKALHERDEVLARDQSNVEAAYNKALMLLSIGEFTEGWKLFDIRLKVDPIFSYDWFPVKRWYAGDEIAGKHVLLWLEQGIGDQIMAMSMVQRLVDVAGSVTLMADRRFAPIVKRTFPDLTFHKVGEPTPERMKTWDFNYQLSVSDLGQMFLRTGDAFNSKPFLKPDPLKVAYYRRKYGASGKPLIGFCWESQNPKFGHLKSLSPEDFMPLLGFRAFQYVSLQYGTSQRDLDEYRRLGADFIHDESVDPLVSLDDSAAQIAAMDMVVSVSNSTVHFAGAMGVPTLALVPMGHGRVWYWFTGYDRSPWYDSVTICRGTQKDQWKDALDTAWDHLSSLAFSASHKKLIA